VRSQIVGFFVLLAASLVVPAVVGRTDVMLGMFAGVSGGIGVLSLYAGLATGRMGVVAPITAALSGTLPAAVDLARGTQVGPTALAGIALALVAVVIVSVTGHDSTDGSARRAIGFALIAGVGFAGSLLAYSSTASDSGFWPMVAGRTTTIVMLSALAFARSQTLKLEPEALKPTLLAGAFDGCANIAVLSAIRIGPLAVASVLAALYPVTTVLLARYVLDEKLHGWQRVGVVLALVAVVLAAL
jgi:drug/metabolite transporter (DMT)-like permease